MVVGFTSWEFESHPWRGVHVASRLFSPGTPVSSTNKSDCHDIPQVLSEMALNTITHITTIFRLDDGTVLTDFCFLVFPHFIDYLHCTITWNSITEKNNHISYFIFHIYYFRVVFTLTDIIEIQICSKTTNMLIAMVKKSEHVDCHGKKKTNTHIHISTDLNYGLQ
jgi:hypothetical protein